MRQVTNGRHRRVLHMTSLTLPLEIGDSSVRHYLYCDNTWHTLQHSPHPPWRFDADAYRIAADLERRAFQSVEHFFTTAEYVRADIVEHYGIPPARVTTVGTGLGGIEPMTEDKNYGDSCILFCAKVRFEEKGGQLLLDAFRQAKSVDDRLRLVLVGQDSYPDLARRIEGAEGYGPVPWADLQALFHQASLFAMPALNEPWGLVYLEALVSRTPVLGLRRNALPEITDNGRFGFLVDDADTNLIATAIVDAMSDPARLREMGRAGQRFCIERYSWDRVATDIASAIGHHP